jgi:hypothetical protein
LGKREKVDRLKLHLFLTATCTFFIIFFLCGLVSRDRGGSVLSYGVDSFDVFFTEFVIGVVVLDCDEKLAH